MLTSKALEQLTLRRIRHLIDVITHKLHIAPEQVNAWLSKQLSQRDEKKVTFRCDNALCCVNSKEINWIQAAGDYMCIYTSGENYVVRTTLADLRRKLDDKIFRPVNRSEVVNLHYVKTIEQSANRVAYLILCDGTRLKSVSAFLWIFVSTKPDRKHLVLVYALVLK